MDNGTDSARITRRDFIRASAASGMGLAAAGGAPARAWASGRDTIRVGLIGCGGRGTGAAHDAAMGSDGIEIVAMRDLFPERMASSRGQLAEALGDRFRVPADRMFSGFDAYKSVIASEVDLVILATPPGFRPAHLRAAVEAGRNVFTEKPVAVDPVGVRSVMETAALAQSRDPRDRRRHAAPPRPEIHRGHAAHPRRRDR
ncbi:MAG: Gfo/Idh/MocA family oxidoreductase [Gemmatimonadetes bacterium]|nr:Gfo/Idh/MocA family oxidoreductase [Gemmatimonadota bacterium]